MHQTDRPEIFNIISSMFFGDQGDISCVEAPKMDKFPAQTAEMAAIISGLIIAQQTLQNLPVKPSGPGALSEGRHLITSQTSC